MSYIPVIKNARIENDAVTSAKVLNGTLTDADIAAANIDGTVGTPSLRTLGNGAQQALAGNTTLDAITAPVADVSLAGFKITNVADPTLAQDAATKAYVDSLAVGLDPKQSVLYTTTGNITLSGTGTQANGTWPAALTAGDRILVKDQTAADENGIYEAAAGAWVRSDDFDGTPAAEVTNGAFTLVAAGDGTAHVGTGWVVTSADPIVVNTDPIVFTQITSPGAVTSMDDLSDASTAGATANDLLYFNGTNWVPSTGIQIQDGVNRIYYAGNTVVGDNAGDMELIVGIGQAFNFFNGDVQLDTGDLTVSAGRASLLGGQRVDFKSVTDHTVDLAADYVLAVDSSVALRTVTLPASHVAGDTIVVKRIGANNVEVATADSDTIDGSASNYVIDVDYMAITLVSNGTNWLVI